MEERIDLLMVLIPALPLAATVITAALGRYVLRELSHWPVLLATVTAFALSLVLLYDVRTAASAATAGSATHAAEGDTAHGPADAAQTAQRKSVGWEHVRNLWTWASVDDAYTGLDVKLPHEQTPSGAVLVGNPDTQGFDFRIDVALRADPLTSIMLSMVTLVSSLVVIYAIGYMHGDPGYWRFFTYVSLFIFSMTMLVSASNFVLLYAFWEAVGLCSYLLVGFWYEKRAAAAAGMKAFLVNRVGDFCFVLGLFLMWTTYGTLNYHDVTTPDGAVQVSGVLGQSRLLADPADAYVGGGVGLAICLLLLAGACGKSAQFPLHVWLPDAMEGPTPVSALIHAATMVTAGVYMVTRCAPLYLIAPESYYVVAAIGAFTALFSAIIAVTQTDLKRVLAYSTISQLGYMFVGLGVGTLAGITAGMFHLFTHAFFKALLFLAAGSVMHAMGGVIDMRSFSGLRRKLPITHATFLIGALALAGFFPLAGFWSKDAILGAALDRSREGDGAALYQWVYYAGLFTAALTSFYTFRAFFMTFYGPERIPHEAGHHAHESPLVMTGPLVILSVFALGVGAWFEYTHGFANFLALAPSMAYGPLVPHGGHHFHLDVATVSMIIAVLGFIGAWYLYLGDQREIDFLTRLMQPVYRLSSGKFFFDPIYNALVIWPARTLATFLSWLDWHLVDAIVNAVGWLAPAAGSLLRTLENGVLHFYALAMMLALAILLLGVVIL
jgi:NADH-quinone oxidoreductase subunit L